MTAHSISQSGKFFSSEMTLTSRDLIDFNTIKNSHCYGVDTFNTYVKNLLITSQYECKTLQRGAKQLVKERKPSADHVMEVIDSLMGYVEGENRFNIPSVTSLIWNHMVYFLSNENVRFSTYAR